MAIKSSNKEDVKVERMVSPEAKGPNESQNENNLRPKMLKDYVWQTTIKKHLMVSISSAKIRKEPLEHILFYWPPGLWKTTLSQIISNEMDSNIKITSGPAIEKQADLVSLLSNLEEWDVLFIDEIHRLRPQVEEILYTAMEDFIIDIMVWKGTGATSVRMPIPPFTLIWATTRLSSLSAPLRDRFWNVLKLDFYSPDDLKEIVKRNSTVLWKSLSDEVSLNIASRSRWTPRISNRLLKIVRDYITIGRSIEKISDLDEIFNDLNIDKQGLDTLDKKYLENIHYKFAGWPVGLNTLASTLWEEEDTLEDVVEPYLLQIWFIERTPRGRKITESWLKHLLSK